MKYKLKNLAGNDIKGTSYTDELQFVTKLDDALFDVKRIVKMRKIAFTTTSNPVAIIDRIHADLFFQTRYLLNEVNVKIKLTKYTSTSAFGTCRQCVKKYILVQ